MKADERPGTYPATPADDTGALRDSPYPPRPIEPDEPSPEQIAIYRAMTPQRRLEIAEQMYWEARELKAAWFRSLHPDWAEERIEAEVKQNFINARS